jgi:hypothetical protein
VTPKTYVPPSRRVTEVKVQQYSPAPQEEKGAPEAQEEVQLPASVPTRVIPSRILPQKSEEDLLPPPPPPAPVGQATKSKDIYGAATLPQEEPEIPKPKENDVPVPKPGDYGEAKDELRVRLEQMDKLEKAKKEAEDYLEQYAKLNLVWLYEIYKMGGIAREEFLQKVKEKMTEGMGQQKGETAAPDNPALANLSREIDKKK